MKNLSDVKNKSNENEESQQIDFLEILQKLLSVSPGKNKWIYQWGIDEIVEHIAIGGKSTDYKSMRIFRVIVFAICIILNPQPYNAKTIVVDELLEIAREEYKRYLREGENQNE